MSHSGKYTGRIPPGQTVHSDHPFGGWRDRPDAIIFDVMLLELGIVVLSIVCFVVLDLYVIGCERV